MSDYGKVVPWFIRCDQCKSMRRFPDPVHYRHPSVQEGPTSSSYYGCIICGGITFLIIPGTLRDAALPNAPNEVSDPCMPTPKSTPA